MDLDLEDKVAIVSASSRGLGKACAQSLAAEGAKVVICGRRPEELARTAQELRQVCPGRVADIHTVTADVTRNEDISRLVKAAMNRYGRVDILVTNAGGPRPGVFSELTEEMWEQGLQSTLWPVIRLIRNCLGPLQEAGQRGGGRIINIVSTTVKQPIDGLLLSNALRPSVIGLAKALSRELAPNGILVNNVCPGSFGTDRLLEVYQHRADESGRTIEEVTVEECKRIPLGRLGDPSELGNVVAFLASARASFITGQTFCVDGGMVAGVFG